MKTHSFLGLAGILGALLAIPFAFEGGLLFGGGTRVFSDMMGRRVEVPEPLTRVALLGGPTGQVAYILGARNQLCAVTKSLKSSELANLLDPSVKDLVAPRSTSG